MHTTHLHNIAASLDTGAELSKYLSDMPDVAAVCGCGRAAAPFLAAVIHRETQKTILIVTENARAAEIAAHDCAALSGTAAAVFPSRDAVPYNMKSPFGPTTEARLDTLGKLLAGQKMIVTAPAAALLQKTVAGRELFNSTVRVAAGTDAPLERISEWLMANGFRRENRTDDIGSFSIRGGILDVYPFLCEHPYRIEFWGDTVESIRAFDVFTQKSVAALNAVDIMPMREFCFSQKHVDAALENMLGDESLDKSAARKLEHQWKSVGDLEGVEWFLHHFDVKTESLLDYLPNDAVIIWDDIMPPAHRFENARENYAHHIKRVPEIFASIISPPEKLLFDDDKVIENLSCYNMVYLDTMMMSDDMMMSADVSGGAIKISDGTMMSANMPDDVVGTSRDTMSTDMSDDAIDTSRDTMSTDMSDDAMMSSSISSSRTSSSHTSSSITSSSTTSSSTTSSRTNTTSSSIAKYKISFTPAPSIQKDISVITGDLRDHINNGYRCIIAASSTGHAERMAELLGDDIASQIAICTQPLHNGFKLNDPKIIVYTEAQILDGKYTRTSKISKRKTGAPIESFAALSPMDTVVHVDHGIGRFVGVERVSAGGTASDCMVIIYAERAKVYVPVDDFHKVQKYIGKEGIAPALSKLGTSSWEKMKERTRESLREMARELIELYAKRQFLEGITFNPDDVMQREFEESFIYEETVDQSRAIKEVKSDMESAKPMDRLICGDVGFGKTEVAMRAAFKAAMSGYQVAILAPTTILAAQHFTTFSKRVANFPVNVESLSRFRTAREQKATIKKLAEGGVDILIGTHRILSQDVKFKNLGLLIIDEEQRFGVKHKEALKQLRYKVDTLSMTATPIPRTLHMSLIGARDLSIINTPPRNRLPIETRVLEYHDELVKRAIEDELERGGQVYFVNNRIKNIDALQSTLEQLVPRAKIISAHGQMEESRLEAVMKEFVAGRYDILLSTVIIENGLDIPNVNTIIVNRADTLGLSQLYQLRGRVGRSSEQAYAYFLTPPFAQLKEDSLKRLKAMEQYTDLGSGFQIAMRDLEIRGAGNILGNSQHGFIAAVGFEMYCRLLQEAVDELRGDAPKRASETRLDIPLAAYIPKEYIADGQTRISIYHELSSLSTVDDLMETERGLADRFGAMPESVRSLTQLMRLKILGRLANCSKIAITKNGVLDIFIEGDEGAVKERIKTFFDNVSSYQFEISYDENAQVKLRTELSRESVNVAMMAVEATGILERVAGSG